MTDPGRFILHRLQRAIQLVDDRANGFNVSCDPNLSQGADRNSGEVPQGKQGERTEEQGDRGISQAQLQVHRQRNEVWACFRC